MVGKRSTKGWLRAAGLILILGSAVLLSVWMRALCESREAYYQGEQYFKKNGYIKAITFFDRSIHWYSPFSPYVEKSAARLWEIGQIAERNGDLALSRVALTALRSGFKAASGLFSPGREWIERCEARMEQLRRMEEVQKGLDPGRFRTQKGVPPPNLFWTLILEIGFLGWVGSVICLVLCGGGKGEAGEENRGSRAFARWGGLLALFYAMWIIGMMKA
ncbi:MAG: hypothetical protein JXL84_18765 [Deltaproteobacteria bacterium]|nr:hypothetical protein [Deltaproteobacteria bacterium]